jgi:hypothetical protein
MMSLQPYFARTALLVGVVVMAFVGCQGQTESDRKGEQSAQTKKVTIDVTGMT